MADSWRNELMRRYPQLFEGAGYPTVGDGWRDLLERTLARIAAAIERGSANSGVRIAQIKEKYGTIRIYWDGHKLSKKTIAEVNEAVELAEARSACTCDECGAEGRLYDRGGWYLTRCENHADGEPVPIRPGMGNFVVVRSVEGGKVTVVSCRRYDRERDVFVEAPLPPDFDEES